MMQVADATTLLVSAMPRNGLHLVHCFRPFILVHITMFAHDNPEAYIDLKPHTESNKLTRLTVLYG